MGLPHTPKTLSTQGFLKLCTQKIRKTKLQENWDALFWGPTIYRPELYQSVGLMIA